MLRRFEDRSQLADITSGQTHQIPVRIRQTVSGWRRKEKQKKEGQGGREGGGGVTHTR